MPCDSDPCPECGAPRNWDEDIQRLEGHFTNLTAQLRREGENSEHCNKLFEGMRTDRDAWKKAYLDLKEKVKLGANGSSGDNSPNQ